MQGDEHPHVLPVDQLCRRCRDETSRYRAGAPHDDRFCFEVFRRAIDLRDQVCWQQLTEIFHEQVVTWCRASGATREADPAELASLCWEKFWRYFTPDKRAVAAGTAGALRYLKTCARSITIDQNRARHSTLPIDDYAQHAIDSSAATEDIVADQLSRQELWRLIDASLRDERERTLLRMMYELGLRSADIHAQRQDLFPTIADVYRLTRNIHDRLGRNEALRKWLNEDGRA